uniref:Large ribosomal subunit protein uL5c n=1 Tax=Lepocinclis steinii TaxID=459226 RepID=A0A3G3LLN1_9EUGL|nr:ribosomal protein L5 [Lepocinclis steinii]AYQ93622.1 ribosomal protein L5 [Lepocinclis steinii]
MQRLRLFYNDVVVPKLVEKFKYKSISDVPKIEKIVINRGLDESCQNTKVLDSLVLELTQVTGQRFYLTRSKKAISNFKLKQNVPIGMCVTLRRDRMYSFFDRLVNLALPRIRDFQGVKSSGFDGFGSYSFGIPDQSMFPEIEFDKISKFKGMDIVIVTTSKTEEEAFFLLKELGMPFK